MSILSQIIAYAPNKIDTEVKARAMVGEPTDEQTQFGKPIYQTPEGEKVSEKSITLFFNGDWMNVPSIQGGKAFNEDELRLMIKQGKIQPTSVHKSKDEAEAAAEARSNSMIQEPRYMYAGGQLVRNTIDGSRPGYSGEDIKKQKVGKYTIERKGKAGLLQPRDMITEPLTSYEKIKLKKKFPKIKFNFKEYPNFGISGYDKKLKQKVNTQEYDAVRRYIFRGFTDTTKFKVLPVSVQNEIKSQFPNVKNWDFKKYAYGVSPERIGERERRLKGLPPKDNRALVRKIARFVDEPEEFRYKFRVGNADGFMLYSMDRAFLQGNENYKPIKRGGKVIGFIDYTKDGGGKKYYYNGYIVNNKLKAGEKIIKDHPDFKNVKKFHDVALKSKLSLDDTSNVFKQLFPKGFDTSKIKFNDLVQFVSNKASKRNIYNSIVKHHTTGVGTNPTKDLQILTSVFNKQADDIGSLIKKGDFSRVPELKEKGIRVVVDGKAYGAPKETAETGYQRILSNVIEDVKTYKPKDFKNFQKYMLEFAGTITDKCKIGNAEGGRIGFKTGSADCLRIAKEGMDEGLTTGKWKSPDQAKMARNIAETAGKISKTGIGARVMAELFGPVALASLPVFEVGIAGYDTITSGTPFKEAINKTLLHYALGDKTKADPEKLQRKDILKMSDGPEKEMLIGLYSNIENLNRVMNNYKQKAGLEQDKELYEAVGIGGYGDDGSAAAQAQKQIEAINNKILNDAAQGKDYMTLSRAVDDPYAKGLLESKQGELLAKRDANSLSSRLFGTENPYYTSPTSSYTGEVLPERIEAMKAKNIGMGDSQLYSRDQIVDFLKTVPDIEITDQTVDFLQTKLNADYFSNVFKQPGMLGTQYSEGGIASLNVNKK